MSGSEHDRGAPPLPPVPAGLQAGRDVWLHLARGLGFALDLPGDLEPTRGSFEAGELERFQESTQQARERSQLDPGACYGEQLARRLPEVLREPLVDALAGGSRMVLTADRASLARDWIWEALAWTHGGRVRAPFLEGTSHLLRYAHGEPSRHTAPPDRRVLCLLGDLGQTDGHAAISDPEREVRAIASAAGTAGAALEIHGLAGASSAVHAAFEVRDIESENALSALLRSGFDVIHFLGHSWRAPGGEQTGLLFPAPVRGVSTETLRGALLGTRCRLVVLHACRIDDAAASALLAAVDHVVGMGAVVFPDESGAWMAPLYEHLLAHETSVAQAVCELRKRIARPSIAWVPQHWTRTLDQSPLWDPAEQALRAHLDDLVQATDRPRGELQRLLGGTSGMMEALVVELALRMAPSAQHGDPLDQPEPTVRAAVTWRLPRYEGCRSFLLQGDAGTGKTTTVRKLVHDLAGTRELVPFHAELSSWPRSAGELVGFEARVRAQSEDLWQALSGPIANGRVLLVLDGLDECEDPEAIGTFLRGLPRTLRVLVASRRTVDTGALGFTFESELLLAELDPKRQEQLVDRLFDQLQTACNAAPEIARTKLLSHLRGDERFGTDVVTNPLYLTHAALRAFRGELPATERHRFFDESITALLLRRHTNPRPSAELVESAELDRVLLRRLAHWLTGRGMPTFTVRDFGAFAGEVLGEAEPPEGWGQHLKDRFRRTDLVYEAEGGLDRWGFDHRTFREALAAEHVVHEVCAKTPPDRERLEAHLGPLLGGPDSTSAQVNEWAEVCMLLTWWLAKSERDAWIAWLAQRSDRLALRAITAGPTPDPARVLEVLGVRGDRRARWEVYRRWYRTGGSVERLETLGALGAALVVCRQAPGPVLDSVEAVRDLALVDYLLEGVQADPERAAATASVRASLIDGLPPVGPSEPEEQSESECAADRILDAAFERVPGTDQAFWAFVERPSEPFRMGSDENPPHHQADEGSQQVVIEHDFWIARAPISVEQYRLLSPAWKAPEGDGDHAPVRGLTWFEARFFCRWLDRWGGARWFESPGARPEDYAIQLPGEGQWEFAARDGGGCTTPFLGGGDLDAIAGMRRQRPGNVAAFGAHGELGLFGMHRLVWQWCEDRYASELPKSDAPRSDWDDDAWRVLRGGAFWSEAELCRSAFRDPRHLDFVIGIVDSGVRPVFAPSPAAGRSKIDL